MNSFENFNNESEKTELIDISNEFLRMNNIEFNRFLRTLKDTKGLSLNFDWVDVQTARKAKAFLEKDLNNQKRTVTIRATRAEYEQDINVFESGVQWEEVV